ncbi:MAG: hypothetical protein FRX49_07589 [Trebouxia sp. A1-2]|nr:MAG: hypothetical protein FRX49_07589 [Trebouxia sp. A1-2]
MAASTLLFTSSRLSKCPDSLRGLLKPEEAPLSTGAIPTRIKVQWEETELRYLDAKHHLATEAACCQHYLDAAAASGPHTSGTLPPPAGQHEEKKLETIAAAGGGVEASRPAVPMQGGETLAAAAAAASEPCMPRPAARRETGDANDAGWLVNMHRGKDLHPKVCKDLLLGLDKGVAGAGGGSKAAPMSDLGLGALTRSSTSSSRASPPCLRALLPDPPVSVLAPDQGRLFDFAFLFARTDSRLAPRISMHCLSGRNTSGTRGTNKPENSKGNALQVTPGPSVDMGPDR